MKNVTVRLGVFAFFALGLATTLLRGAEIAGKNSASAQKEHYGYPTDWSSHQLVIAGATAPAALAAGKKDPRHVYNMVRRMAAIENENTRGHHRRERHRGMKIDWAVSLGNGYVPQSQYPAKYSFQINTEDCNNDYVLFALYLASGSGTQANLVGINNLYTGATPACNSGTPGQPWVAFAYNTATNGGQIQTSPMLSADGTKVAFVESTSTGSYFHVLGLPNPIPAPPAQAGSVLAPQVPATNCALPTGPGCMTTLKISSIANTLSSPWADYNNDSAYFGTDDGTLVKIFPVFGGGTPQLVSNTNWPFLVNFGKVLSSPVVDDAVGRIFLGDASGNFYSVDLNGPTSLNLATKTLGNGASQGGIVDSPLIISDPSPTNPIVDQVFAFTGCSTVLGLAAAVAQLPANFTSGTAYQALSLGGSTGNACPGSYAHMGTVDNTFWTSGFGSGHVVACGFQSCGSGSGACPRMYEFPFLNNQITTASVVKKIDNNKGEECSPLAEFFDGTSDRVFFGTGSSTSGTIQSFVVGNGTSITFSTVTAPSALGGTSGIVMDNQLSNGGTNIYFTTLAPGDVNNTSCGTVTGGANAYCAVKLTQAGLQ
jgi:hypothetical protein